MNIHSDENYEYVSYVYTIQGAHAFSSKIYCGFNNELFSWCSLLTVATHKLYRSHGMGQGWSCTELVQINHGEFIGIE